MKTPEQLMERAYAAVHRLMDPAVETPDHQVAVIAEALAQIQRETAEECVGICETAEVLVPIAEWQTRQKASAATAVGLGAMIRRKFGIDLCNRCGKPKGSAEGCCGCGGGEGGLRRCRHTE